MRKEERDCSNERFPWIELGCARTNTIQGHTSLAGAYIGGNEIIDV